MKTTTTYTLPASWASALVNGDYSGLEDDEADQVGAFLERELPDWCVSVSDEPTFQHRNDSGNRLAGDCLEYTFTK